MKFKQFISEAAAEDLLSVARKYKRNIKHVLDSEVFFFRSSTLHKQTHDKTTDLFWYEQPARIGTRDSVFGNGNWLMAWTEATWKNFPPRSKSYFATQSESHAKSFSGGDRQVMMIVPADDVKSFGMTATDFNEASSEAQMLMHAVRSFLNAHRRALGEELSPLMAKLNRQTFLHRGLNLIDKIEPNASTVKLYIDALDELLDNIFHIQNSATTPLDTRFIKELKEFRGELRELSYTNLSDYLKSVLTPQSLEAKSYDDFTKIKSSSSKDNELWFEGSYLGFKWYGEEEMLGDLYALYKQL